MKRKMISTCLAALSAVGLIASTATPARALRRFIPGQPGAGGMINLPYVQQDGQGNQWMIYDQGWFRQNGNQPVYSQASMLTVNGQNPTSNNAAQLDPKTGEVIFDNMPANGVTVTRRVLISKDDAYVRYIDVFKNAGAQEQSVAVGISTNLNYGVNGSTIVADPKRKENNLAWVAMTGINRAAVDVYAGKGAKAVPSINYQPGNNMAQATMQLTVPPGRSVALMHLHMTAPTLDAGTQWVLGLKEAQLMKSIPADLRRIIVNFPAGNAYIGDVEILRGDLFDVVELRSGDQVKGTLREPAYKLTTFYGNVELPVDQVIGLINVGQFRPRQLVVTTDGQIFGGQLQKETVALEMSSGQVTQIPLSQVSRVGYRKRPGEPEEWTFDKPFVVMRTGDRVGVQMPTGPVDVSTRYGELKLDPKTVASIAFQSEDNGVHTIYLTDGSKFAGLVNGDEFDMKLASGTGAAEQDVKFPASTIVRLQLAGKAADPDDATPTLSLMNDDALVGTLTGDLKLDTSFDTIALNAPEIRRIAHATPGSADVQVTLWDNTTVSGQLEQQDVQVQLGSGATMKVPVALVQEYNQPQPHPSLSMVDKIKAAVAQLNADDWKQRDQAEASIISMGPTVSGVLKEMRPTQPPEAQQRIDTILKQLEKAGPAPKPPAGRAAAAGALVPQVGPIPVD